MNTDPMGMTSTIRQLHGTLSWLMCPDFRRKTSGTDVKSSSWSCTENVNGGTAGDRYLCRYFQDKEHNYFFNLLVN